jgi:hypothetical protein
MDIQEKTPPDFGDLRVEARRIGRRRELVFRVLFALVTGTFLTLFVYYITGDLFELDTLVGDKREEYLLLLSAGISWFVGGFFSGWILEYEVRHRRWRFLWLVVASPVMFLWLFALWQAATQQQFGDFHPMLLIVKFKSTYIGSGVDYNDFHPILWVDMFLSALAGSTAGYWVGYRRRMWWKRKWRGTSDERNGSARRTER